jgi:hypothetical protein
MMNKKHSHPAYQRYPHLKQHRSTSLDAKKMFAWLPVKTVTGKWAWLETVFKTTFTTINRPMDTTGVHESHETVKKITHTYETLAETIQRKLSNEN